MKFTFVISLLLLSFYGKAQEHYSYLQYLPPTLDPVEAKETNSQFVINNAYDGLVSWSVNDGLRPSLAKSWTFSNNLKSITFELRDAKFSDGSQMTSQDVYNHFVRLKSNKYFTVHFNNIKSLDINSSKKITFNLHRQSPHFLHLLAGSQSKIVKKVKNKIIGAGPFIPNIKDSIVTLTRFENYWGKKPNIDKIIFKVLDPQKGFDLISDGQLDDMILYTGSVNDIKSHNEGEWKKSYMWSTWAIALDTIKIPLEHRLEIVSAFKSNEFLNIFKGNVDAYGIQALGMPGYLNGIVSLQIKPPTSRLKKNILTIFVPEEMPSIDELRALIENKKINCCTLKVKPIAFTKIINAVGSGKYSAYLISFNPEYPDPSFLIRALQENQNSNYIRIKNKNMNMLIEKLSTIVDPLERATIITEANSLLMKEGGIIPMFHVVQSSYYRKCVEGIVFNPVSEGYFSLREVVNKCR